MKKKVEKCNVNILTFKSKERVLPWLRRKSRRLHLRDKLDKEYEKYAYVYVTQKQKLKYLIHLMDGCE